MRTPGQSLSRCHMCKTGEVQIIDSRLTVAGWRRRRRRCLNCQFQYTTYEVPSDVMKNYARVVSAINTMKVEMDALSKLIEGIEFDVDREAPEPKPGEFYVHMVNAPFKRNT